MKICRISLFVILILTAIDASSLSRAAMITGSPEKFMPVGGEQGARRDEMLKELYTTPYVQPDGEDNSISAPLGRALAAYWMDKSDEGNKAMLEVAKALPAPKKTKDQFHWEAYRLARVLLLFGKDGVLAPGRMSPEAQAAVEKRLWEFLEPRGDRSVTESTKIWWLWGSENHHLQAWFSMWDCLTIFARNPAYASRKFHDGTTVAELKKDFDQYFKEWIREHATRGLFAECNASAYARYSLVGFYDVVDFAEDPELRRLARNFLDVYWAQWALEQVEGVRAGSRHRARPGSGCITEGSAENLAWYHFGIGGGDHLHPTVWSVATSSYIPSALICEIVKRRNELGSYEIDARIPGLRDPNDPLPKKIADDPDNALNEPDREVYALDPRCGDLLRRTYMTPEFAMGVSMMPALAAEKWTGISSQNRWDGVVFAGKGSPRIFLQPGKPAEHSGSNSQWAVQDRGVMIGQKLATSANTPDLRMFVPYSMNRTEKEGWIFAESSQAYAAIKVVEGGWDWVPDTKEMWQYPNRYKPLGEWIVPKESETAFILEVAPKAAYPDYAAFQSEILTNKVITKDREVAYSSKHYGSTLTLFTDGSKLPNINGTPVNLEPRQCFSGDHLTADFGGDKVKVKAFDQTQIIDFSK